MTTGYLQSTSFENFLNEKFPGLFPEDDILSLMKLMTSRQPGNHQTTTDKFGMPKPVKHTVLKILCT